MLDDWTHLILYVIKYELYRTTNETLHIIIVMYTGRWQTNKMCRLEAYYGIKRPWNRNKGGWKGATKGSAIGPITTALGENNRGKSNAGATSTNTTRSTNDWWRSTIYFSKARLTTKCFHRVFYFKYHIWLSILRDRMILETVYCNCATRGRRPWIRECDELQNVHGWTT